MFKCNFCGEKKDCVSLNNAGKVFICKDCISLCNDIVQEEKDRCAEMGYDYSVKKNTSEELITENGKEFYRRVITEVIEREVYFCAHCLKKEYEVVQMINAVNYNICNECAEKLYEFAFPDIE